MTFAPEVRMFTSAMDIVHRPALKAIVALATSDVRWQSHARLCSDAGIAPSALSMALNGKRPLSESTADALCSILPECERDALILPVLARPGDIEGHRIVTELRRKREADDRFYREIIDALKERNERGEA